MEPLYMYTRTVNRTRVRLYSTQYLVLCVRTTHMYNTCCAHEGFHIYMCMYLYVGAHVCDSNYYTGT